MDQHERRLTENELLFREVNERIGAVAAQFGEAPSYEFLCECSDASCAERVPLTVAQYEHLRSHPERFAVVDGHEVTAIERVVETIAPGVVAVEKNDEAADAARRTDPRSR